MLNTPSRLTTLALCLSIYASFVQADETKQAATPQTEEHEQHGTHEHGVATLTLVKTSEGLEISLESPAANLVGFEHAATSAEDKQKLAAVKAKLEAGSELFAPNAEAGCNLKEAQVDSTLLDNTHEEHAEQGNEKVQASEKTAKHEHDTAEAEKNHSDMDVIWTFSCSKTSDLKALEIKLFSAFPDGLHKLKTEWVTDQGASAQELEKDSTIQFQ